jgi:hypothetical protein
MVAIGTFARSGKSLHAPCTPDFPFCPAHDFKRKPKTTGIKPSHQERAMAKPRTDDPHENPDDDPRMENDWPTSRQTDKPWKGNPEKDQISPDRPDIA